MNNEHHVPGEDLVMFLDGELAASRHARVEKHLAHCWHCRSRLRALEQTVDRYMEVHSGDNPDLAVSARGATARLRATLRHVSTQSAAGPARLSWLRRPALLLGAGLVILWPVMLFLSQRQTVTAAPLPKADLTPGAVRFVSSSEVCRLPVEDEGKLVPKELATVVFREYRITGPQPRMYEVDYLISPSLGGATAVQNLWPVPYDKGVWTSRVKDALEDHLRTLVCAGKLDLAIAQREIAENWIAAYQKYFHSRLPIEAHARFIKDSPWE